MSSPLDPFSHIIRYYVEGTHDSLFDRYYRRMSSPLVIRNGKTVRIVFIILQNTTRVEQYPYSSTESVDQLINTKMEHQNVKLPSGNEINILPLDEL